MRFGRAMGCHQMPERSFFIKGYQFPVCARCTGVLIGQFIGIIMFLIKQRISVLVAGLLCAIMFGDWFIQKRGILMSTNMRRLFTGILGGYGYITILLYLVKFIAQLL